MQAFQDAPTDCDLEDLGFLGDKYNWKQGRIRERPDRVIDNGAWNIMHPGVVVQTFQFTRSDHRPILLDTYFQLPVANQSKRSKKFEAKFLKEKGFREMVEQLWVVASIISISFCILDKYNMFGYFKCFFPA
jgi:hypothetical protein